MKCRRNGCNNEAADRTIFCSLACQEIARFSLERKAHESTPHRQTLSPCSPPFSQWEASEVHHGNAGNPQAHAEPVKQKCDG